MNAIDCHRTRINFDLYLDGALASDEVERLETHLFSCAACAAAVGEDIRLGEILEDGRTLPEVAPLAGVVSGRRPVSRRAAAAVILIALGAAAGHLLSRHDGATPDRQARASDPVVADGGPTGLVPLSDMVEEPDAGLASFSDVEVLEAEREGLRTMVDRSEFRARRVEAELDLMRPLIEETATAERVVERLADRMRKLPGGSLSRPEREDRDHVRKAMHEVHAASSLLRRSPERAFASVAGWLRTARTPIERQAAFKLLASLRLPQAYDLLAAEAQGGVARDFALDGLALLRDPRARELFVAIMEDESLSLDPTRLRAAGGLHRLGDARALEFLVRTYREASPSDQFLRKRILFHVGSNPGRETAAVLHELIEGVRLDPRERASMREWLILSGMSDSDPSLVKLFEPAPPPSRSGRAPHSPPRDR